MRTIIFILGTIGLFMLLGAHGGKMFFGDAFTSYSLNFVFYLGFAFCCVTWFLAVCCIKRFNEDAGLFEEIGESVIIIDRNTRTVMCINQVTINLLGFRREDLLYRPASHMFAGNETIVDKLLEVEHSDPNISINKTVSAMRKDGSLIEMQLSTRPVRYHGSNCIMINGRDMSENRKAMEDQARLAAILESNVSGLCATDREGMIINWNKAATRILGYRAKEVLGKPFMMIVREENREERWKSYKMLLEGHMVPPYEGEAIHKNGKNIYIHMDASPIYDATGKVIGVSALFRDIGKDKENERELEESSQQLDIVLQTAELGLWEYDCANEALVVLSDLSQELFGYDSYETSLHYQKVAGLIHPLDRQQSELEFQRVLQSKMDDDLSLTVRFQANSGSYRWVSINGKVIERNTKGYPEKIIGISQDVSKEIARKQHEESEKLRIKTLLAWSERTSASREDILDFTLEKAVELTNSQLGLIGQIDPENKQISVSWLIQGVWPQKTGGMTTQKTTAERFAINGSPLWTKAIHTGEPAANNNPNIDSEDRNFFGVHNPIEKYMTVPILEDGEIAGVVMVANKEENYASHDVIELQLLAQGMWGHLRKIEIENARKKIEQEKNIILDNLQEGVLCVAKDHRITYANHVACEIVRRVPEEFIGHEYDEPCTSPDYENAMGIMHDAILTKKTSHKEIVASDGNRYDVTAHPVCDEQGEIFRVVETFFALSPEDASVSLP